MLNVVPVTVITNAFFRQQVLTQRGRQAKVCELRSSEPCGGGGGEIGLLTRWL